MSVPFTFDEFLEMLERFNTDWWPTHLFMYALAVAAIYFAIRKTRYSGKVVTGVLVFFWIWVGLIFNLLYFSRLNPMAYALTGFVPFKLGFVEDIGLIGAGIVTGLLLVYRNRSSLQHKGEETFSTQ